MRSSLTFVSRFGYATAQSNNDVKAVVDDLVKKAPLQKLVQDLEKDARVRVPLTEFIEACGKLGVSDKDARQFLRALHDSGRLLHYENNAALSNVVLTKPLDITASLAKVLDVNGDYTRAHREKVQQQLVEYQKEFEALNAKKSELDRIAYRKADTIIGLLFGYLLLQGAFVARLTWWELSWDVMEPVTYMLTFATGVGGMAWFISNKAEYTYEGLRKALANKRKAKIYARNNFSIEHYHQLEQLIAKKAQELSAPELAVLASGHNAV